MRYPHLFTNPATLQVIRLEIGALAAWTPAKIAQIEPYAATYYPKVFEQQVDRCRVLLILNCAAVPETE